MEHDEKYISSSNENPPQSLGRQVNSPVYTPAIGFFQEALYWLSAGKSFQMEENSCLEHGDTRCTILINRITMG
jgi:hypothetical protein